MDQIEQFYEYTSRNPLHEILDQFRGSPDLQACSMQDICLFLSNLQLYLLQFLQSTENHAATILSTNILNLQIKITTGEVSIFDFTQLIYLINFESDRQIWSHIILIADVLTRVAPPILPDLQIPMTPEKRSTTTLLRNAAEQAEYDSTRDALEEALRAELTHDTYKSVDKFWEVNFENKCWYGLTTKIWERYRDGGQCGDGNAFSDNMSEKKMKDWFTSFYKLYLEPYRVQPTNPSELPTARNSNELFVRGKFSFTSCTAQLQGSRCNRQVDVFVESSDNPERWDHHWRDVRVVGEFTKVADKKNVKFHQLMLYVRELFHAQPLRRFVHGFCLYKGHIVFWIIDRSGAYSSSEINVINDQEKLVRALSAYTIMSDEELGLDTTICRHDGRTFVKIRPDDLAPERWVEINPEPVTQPETVLSRGNLCFQTMNMKYLIKFSWGSGAEQSEIDFLKDARAVKGVVDLEWAERIYQVETHRKGLDFSTGKKWDMGVRNWLSIGIEGEPKEYFKKRKLTLAVISPYGRPLKTCSTVREFLSGLLDAIVGHRDLYLFAGILHGDISESNIILTMPDEFGLIHGKLIDLDISMYVAEYNEPKSLIGTMKFMAIKVLQNIALKSGTMTKSYRHDLESFFYVFLVGCVCYGRDSAEYQNHFNNWCSSSPLLNQGAKIADTGMNFQLRIIDNFSPCFNGIKELALELRQILFGIHDIFYDTPRDSSVLYDPIITAFINTIKKIDGKFFIHSFQISFLDLATY
ncbi:serine/threonine-protein kinase Sgk2 [Blumeria hordei DH14]|uniref:Serine/threonine-protein kinase Sgk2 n=1 Tax=Blumeria graminis f. sp. hordei (strain DH14) TaxID=546991 RepID=N1JEC0_BLUG1|nr:serine/threonine-protein kinase Sgk2 [Blumeria hordei DH14]